MKKRKLLRVVLIVLVCVAMMVPSVPVFACGPFFPETHFIFTKHPDLPLDTFAEGELGILQPTYARSYLVVAYRYLSGVGLSKAEQAAAISLWKERIGPDWGSAGYYDVSRAQKRWFETRSKVPAISTDLSGKGTGSFKDDANWNTIQITGHYDSQENCLDPAFETAANTLEARVRQFGIASLAVRSWVGAQDAVFKLCNGSARKNASSYPAQAESSLPEIIQADRAYQAAEAHFYNGDYDGARELFSLISRDTHSQWRATGALMTARSIIRKATLFAPNPEIENAGLREARLVLEGIVKDASMSSMHHAAEDLICFVDVRIDPADYLHRLGQNLARPHNANLKHDLSDYTILLDKRLVPFDDPKVMAGDGTAKPYTKSPLDLVPGSSRSDSLTDWILTFQSVDNSVLAHAIERWRTTGSVAWLVSALTKLKAGDPNAAELLSAARRVETNSPAYQTLMFNVLRVEALSGDRDSARRELNILLENNTKKLPRSALNLFLALRMSLAQNLEEFLRDSARTPTGVSSGEDDLEIPTHAGLFRGKQADNSAEDAHQLFDMDAAWTASRELPTAMLVRAVETKTLPLELRSEVAISTWVRAIVIGDDANATRLAQIVIELEPKLASEMKVYLAAVDPGSRKSRAILTILRTPGMRPFVVYGLGRGPAILSMDKYGNNWWCSLDDANGKAGHSSELASEIEGPGNFFDKPQALAGIYGGHGFDSPSFLTQDERIAAEREWTSLSKREAGATWLALQGVAWAKAHPDDPNAPETLHLAVRTLRYSCGEDVSDHTLSREAFTLLHRKYPNSEWTKKTPFWF